MSDALSALGLEPAPSEQDEPAAKPAEQVEQPTQEPAASEPTEPTEPAEPAEEPVEVPEGAENPDAVRNAIQAERKRAREANARARELERQLTEQKENERPLEERIASAETRAQEAELRALRIEVGAAAGLSVTLASRLTGTTAEEIKADAEALVAEVGAVAPSPGMDGGYRQDPPPAPTDPNAAHQQFIGALLANTRHGGE